MSELSQHQRDKIVRLRQQGVSFRKIGRQVGCTKDTAQKHWKRYEKEIEEDILSEQISLDKRLRLKELESFLADQSFKLMKDQAEIDTITTKNLDKYKAAYIPHTRAGIRRSNIRALKEVHTMLAMTPSDEGPPQEVDMVSTLTKIMEQVADTPEKRAMIYEIIEKERKATKEGSNHADS